MIKIDGSIKSTLILALFSMAVKLSYGANFYVSPTGSPSNDGRSTNTPWDLPTALKDNTNPSNKNSSVKPGDTIWLRGGTYNGAFSSNLKGTSANPVIVRNYNNERAILSNTLRPSGLAIRGAYTWYWGLEVTLAIDVAAAANIDVFNSVGIKLINCITYDAHSIAIGTFADTNADSIDFELYGSLIFYNGRRKIAEPTYPRGGYGIYAQNNNPKQKKIIDNIFFHQWGDYATHIYTENGVIDNFLVEGNVMIDNMLLLGGGPVANNPVIRDNVVYGSYRTDRKRNSTAPIFNLGYVGGTKNAIVTGNYFLDGAISITAPHPGMQMSGNTFNGYFYEEINGGLDGFPTANFPSNYPNNNYAVMGSAPDVVLNQVLVRPNRYEPGRAHITVFNWNLKPTVNADIGSLLQVGDGYEVRDAENYFGGPVVSGVYNGAPINLPMTGLVTAQPGYATRPPHTAPKFGVFILLKTSGSPPPPPPPPTDTTAPQILGVTANGITNIGATIAWNTNEGSNSQVDYGLTTSYGNSTTLDAAMVMSHSQALTGLTAGTLYHYHVKSRDPAGNLGTSTDFTFTTAANRAPTLSAISTNQTDVDAGTPGVQFYPNTPVTYSVSVNDPDSDPLTVTWEYSLTGGSPWTNMGTGVNKNFTYGPTTGITYTWRATVSDGLATAQQTLMVQIIAPPPTIPPTVSLTAPIDGASFTTPVNITIQGTASDTDGTITRVEFYANGNLLGQDTSSPYSFNWNSVPVGAHALSARAVDNGGAATISAPRSITVRAPVDNTPPIISTVASSNITYAGATLSWNTNEMSDTQVVYGLTTSYGNSSILNTAMVTVHSQTLNGLAAGILIHYRVKSRDTAGNLATSADFTFTTLTLPDVNTAPVANSQLGTTNQDTPLAITLTASDTDDDPLVWSIVSNPANGILTGAGPNRTYTPSTGYFGTDSFTFKVFDGIIDSNMAVVTINTKSRSSSQTNSDPITVIKNVFNPTRGEAATFELGGTGATSVISVTVYDRFGNTVREFQQDSDAGSTIVNWNGQNDSGQMAASGKYLVVLKSGDKTFKKKVIVVK